MPKSLTKTAWLVFLAGRLHRILLDRRYSQAIQDQLGLKLDSSKGPVEVLVIDSVQKPVEN